MMMKKKFTQRFRRRMGTAMGLAMIFMTLLAGSGCDDRSRVSNQLRLLGDAPMRIVWCRQETGTKDFFAKEAQFQLMGVDSRDHSGAQVILAEVGSYHKPLFTADGNRIVFTDIPNKTIYVVNWDGSGLMELSSGKAEEVWVDPLTGIEWVYKVRETTRVDHSAHELIRFQLDNPFVEEVVLTDVAKKTSFIQLSQDGTWLCAEYPWPQIAAVHVKSGAVKEIGRGCWPAMAPDNSYLTWIFDGPHRNLIFHSLEGKRWVVNINGAPGVDEYEVYHPRWSNLDRFLCMTGPYRKGLYKGTKEVSVYVGRFNEKLTEVEAWVRVSDLKGADFYPDVWVEPRAGRYTDVDYQHLGDGPKVNHAKDRLVVKARLLEMTSTPTLEEIAPYTQTLVVYSYAVDEVVSGSFDQSVLLVAHWGIVDRETKDLKRQIGDRVELELERYENRDELEGERLVMELSDMHYPLFYDLKGD